MIVARSCQIKTVVFFRSWIQIPVTSSIVTEAEVTSARKVMGGH
jgi:hypothetical protein